MKDPNIENAFSEGDYVAAEKHARALGDRRALAGALLHQRRWLEAFAILDDVLLERGPMFGGPGTRKIRHTEDVREAVLEEARQVMAWASADTPEWVRVLGGMWESFVGDPIVEEMEERFLVGLGILPSLDDFEVVIRQARQRGHLRAARHAAMVGAERFPDDSWIHSVLGNTQRDIGEHAGALASYQRSTLLLERYGNPAAERLDGWICVAVAAAKCGQPAVSDDALARAREFADPDDDWEIEYAEVQMIAARDEVKARTLAVELVGRFAEHPRLIAETPIGIASVELALDLLLSVKDQRAIDVAMKLLAAKQSLWGECPSVWVERQNLGTVYANLGEPVKARMLITEAHTKLLGELGPGHPHVELCERSLARLGN